MPIVFFFSIFALGVKGYLSLLQEVVRLQELSGLQVKESKDSSREVEGFYFKDVSELQFRDDRFNKRYQLLFRRSLSFTS